MDRISEIREYVDVLAESTGYRVTNETYLYDTNVLLSEIDRLNAQLTAVESRNEELECAYAAYDGSALERADQHVEDQEKAIKQLKAQLSASQRRERAAVEDLNALRKKSGWECFACNYSAQYVREVCTGCGYNNGNNWEWRGPQEAGEAVEGKE